MSVIEYLNDKEIEYKSGGKNIGRDFVGLEECPLCNSKGYHFGIHTYKGFFNCWVCGGTGNFIKFVREIEQCGYKKAKPIAAKYLDLDLDEDEEERLPEGQKVLPEDCLDYLPQIHMNYLEGRNFNPSFLKKKYKLKAVHNLGKYRFRIIVPIIMKRQIVNFAARDISGKSKSKYLYPSNSESILPIKSCLYNIDTVQNGGEAIVVEGVTDCWRLGDKSVATLGKHLSIPQLNLLAEKELERVTVIPDEGAEDSAEKVANQLSGLIDNVEIVELPEGGDPADLNVDEVAALRRFVGI